MGGEAYSRGLQRVVQKRLIERKHRIRSCSRPSEHSFVQISESAQIVLEVASIEIGTRAYGLIASIAAVVAQITNGHVRYAMIAAAFELVSCVALLSGLLVLAVGEAQVVDGDHAVIRTSHTFDDQLKLFGTSGKLNSHLLPFFAELVSHRFDQTVTETGLYVDVYSSSAVSVYLIPELERARLAGLVVNGTHQSGQIARVLLVWALIATILIKIQVNE